MLILPEKGEWRIEGIEQHRNCASGGPLCAGIALRLNLSRTRAHPSSSCSP